MTQHAPDVDPPEFDLDDDEMSDDAPPPPPPPIRHRAMEALDRQLETLERIAEDDAADYPHRLRAVEMIAALAGQELRPRGPKHGPPPPDEHGPGHGPPAKHAAAKHAAGKHAPAKHAASKHAGAKHAASKQGAKPRPDGGEDDDGPEDRPAA